MVLIHHKILLVLFKSIEILHALCYDEKQNAMKRKNYKGAYVQRAEGKLEPLP
ncbi:hypothetical protein PAE9249_03607 [Paenibacillus sp. CECT 9249]|nr:hypothetical protein PAE9249_03607 [Paenibacillus sp. CECT 9249]